MLPRGRPFQKDNTKSPLGRGNTFAVKHSLHGYRRMLSGGQLDARTAYKVLGEKAQELVTPLGGDPSPQEPLITADTVIPFEYCGCPVIHSFLAGLQDEREHSHTATANRISAIESAFLSVTGY